MAASCQVCELKEATVYCPNDDARLCAACDHAVHSASALAARHQRVALCEAPGCKLPASVFCKNDQAFLCPQHNEEVHSSNPLAARHTIVPASEAQLERQTQQKQPPPKQELPKATPYQRQAPHTADSMASDDLPIVPTFEDDAFSHSATKLGSPGAVPPALDVPLSMGMNKDALAKSIWGNEGFEMDANAWLDRLDMGFDFSDILGSEDAGSPPTDNLVPTLSTACMGGAAGAGQWDAEEITTVLQPAGKHVSTCQQGSKPDDESSLMDFPAVPNVLDLELDLGPHDVGEEAVATVPEHMQDAIDQLNPVMLRTSEPLPGLGMVPLPPVQVVAPLMPVKLAVPTAGEVQTILARTTRASLRAPVASFGADSMSLWGHTYGTADGETLTREERVARYREKRLTRKFQKTIRYASRKAYAEVRPRIKGRFAKREEVEAWRAAEAAMAAGAAVVAGGDLDL